MEQIVKTGEAFETLKAKLSAEIDLLDRDFALHCLRGVEAGRLICEYAARPEVKAAVDTENNERKARGEGGRPRAYHCYVVDQLLETGLNKSKGQLEACARAFIACERKGLPLDTPVREALGKKLKLIDVVGQEVQMLDFLSDGKASGSSAALPRLLPAPESTPPEQQKRPQFQDFVRGFVNRLDSLVADIGEPALRKPSHQEEWAQAVGTWWANQGITVEICFKNGNSSRPKAAMTGAPKGKVSAIGGAK